VVHLAILIAALVVGVAAELVGVFRARQGKVDTYTEIVEWLSDRFGVWFLPALFVLVGVLIWAIPHLLEAGGVL
jgi:hypothetical protein